MTGLSSERQPKRTMKYDSDSIWQDDWKSPEKEEKDWESDWGVGGQPYADGLSAGWKKVGKNWNKAMCPECTR